VYGAASAELVVQKPQLQPPATPATTPESAPVATPEPAAQPTPNASASASSAATPPVESAAATAQPQAAPSGAKRILLVEDEKALATVMSLKLKNAGYDVVVVYNGDDALRTLGGSYFDLMLVDIMMPKRDGFSVLEELKKQNNQIPVFAMSNLGQEEDIARVKSMGVKEYIVKADASPTDILGRVDAFLKH
jgi:CheY-like chemotaxis protein